MGAVALKRRDADIVDTLKELVPIWKKENSPDGSSTWIEGGTPS